jgi:hypothetical protein
VIFGLPAEDVFNPIKYNKKVLKRFIYHHMSNKIMKIMHILLLGVILFLVGCSPEPTDLEKNICSQDSDCWSTNGGCFTREWFAVADAQAREQGIDNQRPTSTPDIPCTCEQNRCVQHVE